MPHAALEKSRTPSRRTLFALDWLNFLLADVQTGAGPFLAIYLAGYKWNEESVGLALTVGGIAGILTQTPAGGLVDTLRSKRALVGAAVAALAAAGWQHQGDLGITGREAFLPPPDAVYHHLYAVVAGSQPYRDHIDLRDFLRTHPVQAARYADMKHRLAVLLETDRSAYSDGKAAMIGDLLRQARRRGPAPSQH